MMHCNNPKEAGSVTIRKVSKPRTETLHHFFQLQGNSAPEPKAEKKKLRRTQEQKSKRCNSSGFRSYGLERLLRSREVRKVAKLQLFPPGLDTHKERPSVFVFEHYRRLLQEGKQIRELQRKATLLLMSGMHLDHHRKLCNFHVLN